MMKKQTFKYSLFIATLLFSVFAILISPAHKVQAATPVPPQCVMNINIMGGGGDTRIGCNILNDGSTFENGKCYSLNQSPPSEIDCGNPPINNHWQYKCQGSDSVMSSYIDLSKATMQPADPNDNDPVKVCKDAGATYVADTTNATPPTSPTGVGTPPAATPPDSKTADTPPAASGSGAATQSAKDCKADSSQAVCATFNPGLNTSKSTITPCGATDQVQLSIDLGCTGKGSPILDLIFAIVRILSDGVGIIVVGSIIFAGVQYTASRGDPQEVAKAQERVRSSIIAMGIYIFSYAILNWLIPAGLLK